MAQLKSRAAIVSFISGAAASAGVAVLLAAGPGDDGHKHDDHGHDHGMHEMQEMSPEEMMEMWMELGQPGAHHEHLAHSVGSWTSHSSFAMEPGSDEMMESHGSTMNTWVLGGRFIKTDFRMPDFMGQPFNGVGYTGYDNMTNQYVSIWMDNMSTGIFYMKGEMSQDGTLTMVGDKPMPDGSMSKMKMVSSQIDDNTIVDTFHDVAPDGSWYESGKITYTRD